MVRGCQQMMSPQRRNTRDLDNDITFMTKKLLILSVAALALGLAFVTDVINVQNMAALYVAVPAGAIFLGLFMVFKSLEKEALLHDAEQEARPGLHDGTQQRGSNRSSKVHGKPVAAH